MDESLGALADPAHAPAINGGISSVLTARRGALSEPLRSLVDPRRVRAELSRLRGPAAAEILPHRPGRARGETRFDVVVDG